MIEQLMADEALRKREFPVAEDSVFFSHASVTCLPARVRGAIEAYLDRCVHEHQEPAGIMREMNETRRLAAELIGARSQEIALLGPTSLGLSLFANGIDWKAGDEVLCYFDDYPANVYPWINLRAKGVTATYLKPDTPGELTLELVERSLTPSTRLVSLASCHFLTGYRIDIDAIGQMLHERGVLFCVDGIQTIGAFPTRMEHVDFMSADAHKWMLGPMAMGIVYVNERHFDLVRPTLLGSWNIVSPNFIAQDRIDFVPTARRYEPGAMNFMGILGMKAGIELLLEAGIDAIASQLLRLKKQLVDGLHARGFQIVGPTEGPSASSITSFTRDGTDTGELFEALKSAGVVCSHRHNREGIGHIRFSPHFYNTPAEIDHALKVLAAAS